jgi:hypothetical protein
MKMGSTRSFRFAADGYNRRLIGLLKQKKIRHSVDETGVIYYASEDEDYVENDLIAAIRNSIFSSWQVLSCPKEWVKRYRFYMSQHGISFEEEWDNGQVCFLLPRKYRPHRWKLDHEPLTELT